MRLITDNTLSRQNPTIPVRWCVEREELVELKNFEAENIHVLLAVLYANGCEDRWLVPWDQAMEYVSFRYPGDHTLYARLVWTAVDHLERMKKFFLERSSRRAYENNIFGYRSSVFNSETNLWSGGKVEILQAEMCFSVPKEYFAKEPPEWLKRWANVGFEYPPEDQCAMRRRLIYAFTLKPLLVAIWLTVRTIVAVVWAMILLFLGMRDINFSPIIHPWKEDLGDIHGNLGKSWFTTGRRVFGGYEDRSYRIFIHPLSFAFYFLVVGLGESIAFKLMPELTASWPRFIGEMVLCGTLGFSISWAAITRKERKTKLEEEEKRAEMVRLGAPGIREQLRLERERQMNEAFGFIGCSTVPAVASLKTLPPAKQTFHLRYMDFKAKVCKKFAG